MPLGGYRMSVEIEGPCRITALQELLMSKQVGCKIVMNLWDVSTY